MDGWHLFQLIKQRKSSILCVGIWEVLTKTNPTRTKEKICHLNSDENDKELEKGCISGLLVNVWAQTEPGPHLSQHICHV